MPKIPHPGTFSREAAPDFLLSVLSSICQTYGQTFSWYTSSKGRVWLTLKGRDPIIFTTSVECPLDAPIDRTLDALVVLFASHIPKVQQVAPPLVTWINAKSIGDQVDDAWKFVSTLDLVTLGPIDQEEEPIG